MISFCFTASPTCASVTLGRQQSLAASEGHIEGKMPYRQRREGTSSCWNTPAHPEEQGQTPPAQQSALLHYVTLNTSDVLTN